MRMTVNWSTAVELKSYIQRTQDSRSPHLLPNWGSKVVVTSLPSDSLDQIMNHLKIYEDMREISPRKAKVKPAVSHWLSENSRIQRNLLKGSQIGLAWAEIRNSVFGKFEFILVDLIRPQVQIGTQLYQNLDTRIWIGKTYD